MHFHFICFHLKVHQLYKYWSSFPFHTVKFCIKWCVFLMYICLGNFSYLSFPKAQYVPHCASYIFLHFFDDWVVSPLWPAHSYLVFPHFLAISWVLLAFSFAVLLTEMTGVFLFQPTEKYLITTLCFVAVFLEWKVFRCWKMSDALLLLFLRKLYWFILCSTFTYLVIL